MHDFLEMVHLPVEPVPAQGVGAGRMCPPTHSIATVPIVDKADGTLGMPWTNPRPTRCATADGRCASASPTSSIFTMPPTTPIDTTVITMATTTRMMGAAGMPGWPPVQGDHHDLGGQDEIGADRAGHRLVLRSSWPVPAKETVCSSWPRMRPHTFSAPS